tara:strand:- start:314 stop:457 length:144 start_codon:yes stop_codon:yes gene_type:complete
MRSFEATNGMFQARPLKEQGNPQPALRVLDNHCIDKTRDPINYKRYQ